MLVVLFQMCIVTPMTSGFMLEASIVLLKMSNFLLKASDFSFEASDFSQVVLFQMNIVLLERVTTC